MPVVGPAVAEAAFVQVVVAAWRKDLAVVAAWRKDPVVRMKIVAAVAAVHSGRAAAELPTGRGSRKSQSAVVAPVAEVEDHSHQSRHP